jgi:hypothetical protein
VDRDRGVWTGEEFSRDERDARLYLDFQAAAHDLRFIELWERSDETSTTYRGSVNVTVIGEPQMDLAQLQDYLAKATKLSLTKATPDGETVLIDVDWDKLVEADAKDQMPG